MNFFEQQDRARRHTAYLLVLMCLAVLGLIAFTSIAVVLILAVFSEPDGSYYTDAAQGWLEHALQLLDWPLVGAISVVVISVVLLGALYKHAQLRSGGKAVAEALDGRLIQPTTTDPDERRILNVVEEMAIAAGTPVPPVYVIEDDSINAFAAGHSPQDAVIGVTRGCISLLTREELQGVVAHEFSHIFHGDMRLNLRLVATLHGILLIGLIGYFLVRSTTLRRGRDRDKAVIIILTIGIVLVIVGSAGTFCGNLIKAAVSRQREFLADASAVQFTRNPRGIANALKKIGSASHGSRLQTANANEFSHMFFGQAVKASLGGLMATHPPLAERIRRLEPDWDGVFIAPEHQLADDGSARSPVEAQHWGRVSRPAAIAPRLPHAESAGTFSGPTSAAAAAALPSVAAHDAIESIGQPQARHIDWARRTLADLPARLRQAAQDAYTARALVYGLLLSPDPAVQTVQLADLESLADPDVYRALLDLRTDFNHLDPGHRLPLLELALPVLRQQSPDHYTRFKQCLIRLITADNHISLMEWALYRLVIHHLEGKTPSRHTADITHHKPECELLLTAMARAGADPAGQARGESVNTAQARAAFASAARELPFEQLQMLPENAVTAPALEAAIIRLSHLRPSHKPALLNALARVVEHDGQVTAAEAELLRAIADSLDCPLPPLVGPANHLRYDTA